MSKTDTLLQAAIRIMVNEDIQNLPSLEELEKEIQVSENFKRKMERLLRKVRIREQIRHAMRNAAAVILILLAFYMTLFAFNDKVRAFTMQFIRTYIIEKMTAYTVPSSSDSMKKKEKQELKGIELTYVPEGFELVQGLEEPFDSVLGEMIFEEKTNQIKRTILELRYRDRTQSGNNLIDNENNVLEHVILNNGMKCDYYRSKLKGDISSLIWSDDSYIFSLSINDNDNSFTKKELIKIAENIQLDYN